MDFLKPNNKESEIRLRELLKGKTFQEVNGDFRMSSPLAEMISDKLDDEGFDVDWGTISS